MKRSLILSTVMLVAIAVALVTVGPAGGQSADQPDRLRIGTVDLINDDQDVAIGPVGLMVYKNTQGGGQPLPDQEFELTVIAQEEYGLMTFSAKGSGLAVCSAFAPDPEVEWVAPADVHGQYEAPFRHFYGPKDPEGPEDGWYTECGSVGAQLVEIGCGNETVAGSGSVACSAHLRFHALVHVDEPYGNYVGPASVEFWHWILEGDTEANAEMVITLPGEPISWSKATHDTGGDWMDPAVGSVHYYLDYQGAVDADGDTYPASVDCDDNDPAVNPGADEVCNGIDDDCDSEVDEAPLADEPADDGIDVTTWTCDGGVWFNVIAENWCVIDGTAYADGTVNPDNSGEACISLLDPEGWSPIGS